MDELLERLYYLVSLQETGISLTAEKSAEYVGIYETLIQNNIEIPFGVEI